MTEAILLSTELNCSEVHDENDTLLMSLEGYMAASLVLLLIGFFGFFLNLIVIILMLKDKQLWSPINVILFNLICSDFSVSILGNPWTMTSAMYRRWIYGEGMCVAYGFFMSLLGIASITTLTVLALERYIMVSKPFKNGNLSYEGSIKMIIGIWVYAFMLTSPPLFGWGKYGHEAANISCSVNWEEQTWNAMTYIMYLLAFGLIVPLIVIIFSYANIIHIMKQKNLKMGMVSKAEGRVAIMVLVMIVAFLTAWTPYAIFAIISQFGRPNTISPSSGVIPAIMAKSSICYNPIIYIGLNTQYRQSWKQMLCANKNANASSVDDMENTQCNTNSRYISNTLDTDDMEKTCKFNTLSFFNSKFNKSLNKRVLEGDGSQELAVVTNKTGVTSIVFNKTETSNITTQV